MRLLVARDRIRQTEARIVRPALLGTSVLPQMSYKYAPTESTVLEVWMWLRPNITLCVIKCYLACLLACCIGMYVAFKLNYLGQ